MKRFKKKFKDWLELGGILILIGFAFLIVYMAGMYVGAM